jgi:hypothetical protein
MKSDALHIRHEEHRRDLIRRLSSEVAPSGLLGP